MSRADLDPRERLPDHLLADPRTAAISEAMLNQAQRLVAETMDLGTQFSPTTATWALELWEQLTGITPQADQSLEERRSAVITMMRSTGTTTAEMIRRLAEGLTGYSATVTEHFEDYSFSLRFFGSESGFIGIDEATLRSTVERIKPAHLCFVIEPITWGDLEGAKLTWEKLEQQFPSWNALESSLYCHPQGAGES